MKVLDISEERVILVDVDETEITLPLPQKSEEFISAFETLGESEKLLATVKAAYGWRGIISFQKETR